MTDALVILVLFFLLPLLITVLKMIATIRATLARFQAALIHLRELIEAKDAEIARLSARVMELEAERADFSELPELVAGLEGAATSLEGLAPVH